MKPRLENTGGYSTNLTGNSRGKKTAQKMSIQNTGYEVLEQTPINNAGNVVLRQKIGGIAHLALLWDQELSDSVICERSEAYKAPP